MVRGFWAALFGSSFKSEKGGGKSVVEFVFGSEKLDESEMPEKAIR